MKATRITTLLLGIIVCTSCATTGYIPLENATKELVSQHIVQGKTTKPRMVKCFGDANSVTFNDSGNEVWVYQNKKITSQVNNFVAPSYTSINSNASIKELVIIFDRKGVVLQYSAK